jgi:sulfite reductase (NADPH) hemoprotein beta-component
VWESRALLPKQTKWILGSDSWSTDIGYSGIHHVIASGQNVNVLILETTPHTVGAQMVGTKTKKDIGLYCMNYGNCFVASVSVGDSHAQAVRALAEADAYDGPSIILAYAPRAPESTGGGSADAADVAVAPATPWPLYRWNPRRPEQPFQLDSQALRKDLEEFASRSSHLTLLAKKEQTSAADFKTSLEAHYDSQDLVLKAELESLKAGGGGQVDMSIVIAYGSDSGKGAKVAGRIKRKAELRNVREVKCIEANDLSMDELAAADVVAFVMSTAGQGEFCFNSKKFGEEILNSKQKLKGVRFGVFGLGDSHYWGKGTADSAKYFNLPAQELDAALHSLEAEQVLEVGLGDDQHANGVDGTFVSWEARFFKALDVNAVGVEDEVKVVGMIDDVVKRESNYLRGNILESLADLSTGAILPEDGKLTKFHGIYQQDHRELRAGLEEAGLERAYSFMIRIGIPGGVCTPQQYLAMSALARSHCSGTLKLTTRQAFQFHGIIKSKLKATVQIINRNLMDTLAACGDVNRNIIASPTPHQSEIHAEVLDFARKLNTHLKPQTQAYHEIWLDKHVVAGHANVEVEPLYHDTYLPRKFKIAIAVPPMNDVDVFSHCLGYVAVVVGGKLLGFNVCVGGGMGTTHGNTKTYPRLSDVMGFCTVEQAIEVGEKVMLVQRDYGDRDNRKHARCKYTVEDHGIVWYRQEVERRCGFKLGAARPFKFTSNGDRFGWFEGVDGNFHYGLFVENGRLRDSEKHQLRTGMDAICRVHTGDFRLTANQNCIIGSVTPEQRPIIQRLLDKHRMDGTKYSGLRLNSMACVALPTCALAMAESERYLPDLIDNIDLILDKHKLHDVPIMIRMSGCPNGCSRPFMAEIVFVGKAPETYNMYLGGGFSGNRLAKIFREGIKEPEILRLLEPIIADYATKRLPEEHFGDFVIRTGVVQPTLAGRVFHEQGEAANQIEGVPPQVYW